MFKLLKWAVILVVLAVVGVVVAVYLSLDGIVKRVVEKEGTAQLNVPTTLDSASLGVTTGSIGFKGFAVGSPAGFTAPHMLSVGGLDVKTAGVTHLRDKPLHVTEITIDGPLLVIEQKGLKFNFKELMDGLPNHGDASPKTADSNPTKLIIDTLTITNATVQVVPDAGGIAGGAASGALGGIVGNDLAAKAGSAADKAAGKAVKAQTIKLPSIQPIKDIGKDKGGVEVKDVVVAVVQAMAQQAIKDNNLPIDPGLLNGNLDSVKSKATDLIQDQLQKQSGKLPGGVGDLLNKQLGGGKK